METNVGAKDPGMLIPFHSAEEDCRGMRQSQGPFWKVIFEHGIHMKMGRTSKMLTLKALSLEASTNPIWSTLFEWHLLHSVHNCFFF